MTNDISDYHPKNNESYSQFLSMLRVLVVDNDVDSCILIKFILESFNFHVMTASSVMEAIKLVETFKPNLLISDIVLPQINGYTLIRKIRTLNPPLGQIPAIAVTVVDVEEGRTLALKYGFQAYLIKPIDPDELMLEIAKLLKIHPKHQLPSQNSFGITSTEESLFTSESKQVDKLSIKTKALNKDFANQVIARSQELHTHSKQLQRRYHDLGCRFVALKAHFAQRQQKLEPLKFSGIDIAFTFHN
ncbi:hypothetical protein NUACC21_30810 [Scytonema sp. NUACC21]